MSKPVEFFFDFISPFGYADRRQRAENWDQFQADMQARTDAVVKEGQAFVNSMREKYPSLAAPAPTDPQIAAQRLRDFVHHWSSLRDSFWRSTSPRSAPK